MKNKSTTFSSGVVITFSLWIVNSSSVRTSVISTQVKGTSHVISIPWIKQQNKVHQACHHLCSYHAIILSGQHSKTSTNIQKEQPWNHSICDRNKVEPDMEETQSRAGFSSYPNQVLASLNAEPPRTLCNTTFHPFENLPSSKEKERERYIFHHLESLNILRNSRNIITVELIHLL